MGKPFSTIWKPALALTTAILALTIGPARAQDNETQASTTTTPLGAQMTGQTKRFDSAGWIEAKLLSGLVVKEAARRIVDSTGTEFSSLSFVVLPVPKEAQDASSMVGGKGWDVIEGADQLPVVTDLVLMRDSLERFRQRYGVIAANGTQACRSSVQAEKGFGDIGFGDEEPEDKDTVQQLGEITGIMNAATPLLNLLKQDFFYHGIHASLRDGMLVTAIRGEIAQRRKPAGKAAGGARTLTQAVEAIGQRLTALPGTAQCENDDGAEKARAALAGDFDQFRNNLTGPGSVAGTTLLAAAEDQLRRYGPRPATMVLAIDADGASLVERKNLFTMFGAESVTVSSGVVVSYEFYEPRVEPMDSLRAAGVLSCMSGAVGIRSIHSANKIRSKATCF